MPRMLEPKKDVRDHDSRRLAVKKRLTRRCPNEETPPLWGACIFIDTGGERPELKHLSKGRKINHRDSVSKR